MTAPRFEGQLPDGTFTMDIAEYGRAWNELGLRVAEKLGAELMGCDPFIMLRSKDGNGPGAQLPLWVAKRVLELK